MTNWDRDPRGMIQQTLMTRRGVLRAALGMSVAGLLVACGGGDDDDDSGSDEQQTEAATASETEVADTAPPETEEPEATETEGGGAEAGEVDMAAIKTFALGHAQSMREGTMQLAEAADRYYSLVSATDFDYQAALDQNAQEIPGLLAAARQAWLDAHTAYELAEGIVAGVPSLSDYDAWIDAGPSGEADPTGARDWQLELPNGEVLDKPGNIFHSLLEPALWGTIDSSVGARLDMDGDGETGTTDVLPEANLFVASAKVFDDATAEMNDSITAWEPTLSDVFSAEVTMIPTMSEYFEQWKNSVFVSGDAAAEVAFISHSRLIDVDGILTGLHTIYQELSPAVAPVDADLDDQILSGFDELVGFVGDLLTQEQDGTVFAREEADLFGTKAQDLATGLAGQVAQASALLNVELAG